jgi:hypothetical protein
MLFGAERPDELPADRAIFERGRLHSGRMDCRRGDVRPSDSETGETERRSLSVGVEMGRVDMAHAPGRLSARPARREGAGINLVWKGLQGRHEV